MHSTASVGIQSRMLVVDGFKNRRHDAASAEGDDEPTPNRGEDIVRAPRQGRGSERGEEDCSDRSSDR
jgi:hypothetical protein